MPVDEMLQRMSAREFVEWQAFYELEGRVRSAVAKGMDPGLAEQMVFDVPDEDAAPAEPKKYRPRGRG